MQIFKLKPVFKDYIWGGNRLCTEFGYNSGFDKTAEAWLLSCHKDGSSKTENNDTLNDLINKFGKDKICGKKCEKLPYFPVLIKLIDAHDNLSVQVHPTDDYAIKNVNEFGKTEIWYVLDAKDDASLIYGFKEAITKSDFKNSIENDTLLDKLNKVSVKKGDLLYIEAGTVHAIGKGALIAEIQQNSNCTYRVFDYNRGRELHINKALDVAKLQKPNHEIKNFEKIEFNKCQELISCEYFTVNRYKINNEISLNTNNDSFNHILVLDGQGEIENMKIKKGDSIFVPACYGKYHIKGCVEILITKILNDE